MSTVLILVACGVGILCLGVFVGKVIALGNRAVLVAAVVTSAAGVGCAPRCHVRQVQWFDFTEGQASSRIVPLTVCDGGLRVR